MPGTKYTGLGRICSPEGIALAAVLVALAFGGAGCGSGSDGVAAVLRIDASLGEGTIDRRIYGHFIEHVGYCIYGGIWDSEADGFRADVLAEVAALEPVLIRYPGGCFADSYHWEDGIGPRAERPLRENEVWGSVGGEFGSDEPIYFGTDEFLAFCEEVGAASYLTVNFGSGTPEEAARWVEYVNGPVSSAYGALRAENGHPAPYGVKLWGVGNEIYGSWEIGNTDASTYADGFIEFAAAMKEVDPEIELVAVGCPQETQFCPEGWNRTVIERAGHEIDHLSLHKYLPGVHYFLDPSGEDDYYSIVASPVQVGEELDESAREIQEAGGGDRVGIALDEWNILWDYGQILHSEYTLRDALFAAGILNLLERRNSRIRIANIAQMLNALGLINTDDEKLFLTPIYFVFQMYSRYSQSIHVPVETESDTFRIEEFGSISARRGVPYLDASASMSPDGGRLAVFVVNRHFSEPIRARIEISGIEPRGEAAVYELNGPDPEASNNFDAPRNVLARDLESIEAGKKMVYSFPAHSLTVLVFPARM